MATASWLVVGTWYPKVGGWWADAPNAPWGCWEVNLILEQVAEELGEDLRLVPRLAVLLNFLGPCQEGRNLVLRGSLGPSEESLVRDPI